MNNFMSGFMTSLALFSGICVLLTKSVDTTICITFAALCAIATVSAIAFAERNNQ